MINLNNIDTSEPYKELSEETLIKYLEDIFFSKKPTDTREFVIWCIDEADGVAKNYEDTLQFRRALREEVKKTRSFY